MQTPSSTIALCGTFEVASAAGTRVSVSSMSLGTPSYSCDLAVHYAAPQDVVLDDEDEFHDNVLSAGFMGHAVNAKLRELGYTGTPVSRAESGMQSNGCMVFEGGDDFQDWARTKGWKHAEGDAYLAYVDFFKSPAVSAITDSKVRFKYNDDVMVASVPKLLKTLALAYFSSKEDGFLSVSVDEATIYLTALVEGYKQDPQSIVPLLRAQDPEMLLFNFKREPRESGNKRTMAECFMQDELSFSN